MSTACELDVIMRHCSSAGFVIKIIHCNGKLKGVTDKVKHCPDTNVNHVNADDHVPEAERNNRTIEEWTRAEFHRLPHKAIPHAMMRHLAMESAHKLNLFPVKGGVSPCCSPQMTLSQKNLD